MHVTGHMVKEICFVSKL